MSSSIEKRLNLSALSMVVPVSEDSVQAYNHVLFLPRKLASFEAGPEVVDPPEPATLAAAAKSCSDHERKD